MLFSQASEYAILALLHITKVSEDQMVSVWEISDRQRLAYPFLATILQALVKHNPSVFTTSRDRGFSLGLSSSEIKLSQIVEAINGVDYFEGCLLGFPACNNVITLVRYTTYGWIPRTIAFSRK